MTNNEKENMLDRAETVVAILESEINSLNSQIKRNKEVIARMEAEFAAAEEDSSLPDVNDLQIPDASIPQTPSTVMTQIITEDTTVAKLAEEYASSEKEILKRNPHLAAASIVKRGTKVVL